MRPTVLHFLSSNTTLFLTNYIISITIWLELEHFRNICMNSRAKPDDRCSPAWFQMFQKASCASSKARTSGLLHKGVHLVNFTNLLAFDEQVTKNIFCVNVQKHALLILSFTFFMISRFKWRYIILLLLFNVEIFSRRESIIIIIITIINIPLL